MRLYEGCVFDRWRPQVEIESGFDQSSRLERPMIPALTRLHGLNDQWLDSILMAFALQIRGITMTWRRTRVKVNLRKWVSQTQSLGLGYESQVYFRWDQTTEWKLQETGSFQENYNRWKHSKALCSQVKRGLAAQLSALSPGSSSREEETRSS